MLTGVWLLSTLAATLVAWGAVRLVADQVSPGAVSSLPTAVALADVDLAAGGSEDTAGATPRASPQPQARPTGEGTAPARPARGDAGTGGDPGPAGESPAAQTPADEPAADDPAPQPPSGGDGGEAQEPDPVTTRAYDLVGGVVTVRYQGTSTRLVEASPNSGFVVEVHDGGPGKVDVRFRSDEHESRFVTRVRDGSPDPQREERPR